MFLYFNHIIPVYSTISDLGFSDYSEYFIGHAGSTYYRKSEKEKAELFRKIESSLTFQDFLSLERKGADVQSKIEVLEQENYALRRRDSVNTYRNSTVNNILDDIAKKYKINTSKERLREDVHVQSMFKKSNSNIERILNV